MVTDDELAANDLADSLAKRGVEHHRVMGSDVRRWNEAAEKVTRRAVWIGKATTRANDFAEFPFRDSEASTWRAAAATRKKGEQEERH